VAVFLLVACVVMPERDGLLALLPTEEARLPLPLLLPCPLHAYLHSP
jgi:hypothetical protein